MEQVNQDAFDEILEAIAEQHEEGANCLLDVVFSYLARKTNVFDGVPIRIAKERILDKFEKHCGVGPVKKPRLDFETVTAEVAKALKDFSPVRNPPYSLPFQGALFPPGMAADPCCSHSCSHRVPASPMKEGHLKEGKHGDESKSGEIPQPGAIDLTLPTPPGPLQTVNSILEDVKEIEIQVAAFNGTTKEYKYLEETLTQILSLLQEISSEGNPDVKIASTDCILRTKECLKQLERKIPPTVTAPKKQ